MAPSLYKERTVAIDNINWYPGHMKKTRELIAANLKLVGAVVEVCDARIPISSRNPIMDEITAGKPRVLAFNKSDLADERATKDWISFYRNSGDKGEAGADTGRRPAAAVALNSMSGSGAKQLFAVLDKLAEKSAKQGSLRIMIVGVPNSGKSSLINRLSGRRAAQTGDRPGVTRGKQWLTLPNGMQLLDTPGILWPKFEDPNVGINLAFCGSIRDEIMDVPDLALELLKILAAEYEGLLRERYGIGDVEAETGEAWKNEESSHGHSAISSELALAIMDAIAKKRGCILPGKRIDYERTGHMLLDEFRSGKLGRITLERI
jgi:ribosome biogenesis GTPase A